MVIIANGSSKCDAISQILNKKVDHTCPATIVNEHSQSYLFIDKLAKGVEL